VRHLPHIAVLGSFLLVSAALLWWAWLPPRLRRGLALVASAAGLVFLLLALNTAGYREAETTGAFVLGPTYVSGHASASASLPYYVITAVCLLMGTAGLALPDALVGRMCAHPVTCAVGVSALATVVRFALEKAAAPREWTWAVGVTWLAPLVGAFLAVRLKDQGRGLRALAAALLAYGLASRGWVALTYVVATLASLGSHYDLSSAWVQLRDPLTGAARMFDPGSVTQMLFVVVVPQLLVWPVYTLVAGLVGAAAVALIMLPRRPRRVALPVEMKTAAQDR
jgi:hypothetical protein